MKTSLRPIRFIALFVALSFVLVNCSKDKKIERRLHKRDGEWNIVSASWQQVIQDTSGQSVAIGTSANIGTFTFEKDGSGVYNFTVNGSSYSQSFDWSVNDESIVITKTLSAINIITGNYNQVAVAFSGTRTGKTTIELSGSETKQYTSGPVTQAVVSGTFSLEKK